MATTEQDIFDRLTTSLRAAADCCDKLASSPKKGQLYLKLRRHLRLIEGACRQAGFWREDIRWQRLGLQAHYCHERAGDWLRSHAPAKYFTTLATSLRKILASTNRLRHRATGRSGPILPIVRPVHRDTRPVGWTPTASGLLVPEAV